MPIYFSCAVVCMDVVHGLKYQTHPSLLTSPVSKHHQPMPNFGSEKLIVSIVSPRERPDRSNTTEMTIASRRPGSTSASWNISRSSSSEWDLMRHRATARPGLWAGISYSGSYQSLKTCVNGCGYTRNQKWMIYASK
jgi:hypothetical protein